MNLINELISIKSEKNYIYEIETNNKIYYKDLINKIKKSKNFSNLKFKSNVLTILPNSIKYIELMIETIINKHVFCPIPYFTDSSELKKIIDFLEPNVIITDRPDIKKIIKKKYVAKKNYFFLKKKKINLKNKLRSNTAAIYYSSGTTGNPKAVMYSHENIFYLIKSIIKSFNFTTKDNQMTFLPFGHTASINYNIYPSLFLQNNLFISKGFENISLNFFKILNKYNITYTQIVPTILLVLNKLNLKKIKLRKLRFIGCGSSTLPLPSQKIFINKYLIKISNLYGLSETGPTHFDDILKKNWKPGSIGEPLDVNKVKIHKREILIKGKNVFIGYFKNSNLYKKVVQNGWFRSGDLGYKKKNIYFYLDRSKDLIIKGGINIYPSEIEDVLYGLDFIDECAVIPIKNNLLGEEIGVVIKIKEEYKKEDKSQLIENLTNHCKKFISNYKIPTKIMFKKNLIKTQSKKISRSKTLKDIEGQK